MPLNNFSKSVRNVKDDLAITIASVIVKPADYLFDINIALVEKRDRFT